MMNGTVAMDGLSKLETAILKVAYDTALEQTAADVRTEGLASSFSASLAEQVGFGINALVQAGLLAVTPPAQSPSQGLLLTTPSGFVDYVQHFRPDIEHRVREAAQALSAGRASGAAELVKVTSLTLPVAVEIVRLLTYEGYIEYDPESDHVTVLGTTLAEIYG